MNPDNTPASGISVKADQLSHKFLFGCGAFDTVWMQKVEDEEKKAFVEDRMNKWLGFSTTAPSPSTGAAMSTKKANPISMA